MDLVTDDAAEVIPAYARAGLPVLPLHTMRGGRCTCRRSDCAVLPDGTTVGSPAKHPLTGHGKDDATTDIGVIAEWLARWPGCNWGVRPPAGVVVLDVDVRSGGPEALADLEGRHGALPATLTARTGSGGRHLWFSYNGPTRGRLCTGVDIKSNSGYVVVPPSVHACGGTYEWVDQRPAAYAPQWVKDILNPPIVRRAARPGGGSLEPLVRFVSASTEGERNRRLYWAACRAAEKGLDPEPLVEAAVTSGLTPASAAASARSAGNAVPRGVAPVSTAAEFIHRKAG